jgi:hypothetical protein
MTNTIKAIPFKSLREQRQIAEAAVINQKTKIIKVQIKLMKMKTELIDLRKLFAIAKLNEKDGLKNNVQKATLKK